MENNIENFEEKIRFEIHNQKFLNKTALKSYMEWDALALKNFVDCRFEKIELLGKPINFCKFKNSEFNHFSFRKCQFGKCTFENCQIVKSNITRAEFRNCNFINCEFLESDLGASDFWNCNFSETRFKDSNLKFIIIEDVKVWESGEWIQIKDFSNFENH